MKNNTILRILNLGTSMAVAAAVGVCVTAAKATVDVFVGQYDADDQALENNSHQRLKSRAFNAVLSARGSGGADGGGGKGNRVGG
jgi:hypothetical protein